jgi:hypothetical protein
MALTASPGPNRVILTVTNPSRDDLGGMRIWGSTTSGFTPGSGNLLYDGPDLVFVHDNLPAGVPYYYKATLYSQIEPEAEDVSGQVSATPTGPSVAAEDIFPGSIRGAHLFAGKIGSIGTIVPGAITGGTTTLPLANAVDFPNAGSGWILDPDGSISSTIDSFSWTGKTGNTLTGCTGISFHAAGMLVIPQGNALVFENGFNELKGFGNLGDGSGAYGQLFSLGVGKSGTSTDYIVLRIGASDSSHVAIQAYGAVQMIASASAPPVSAFDGTMYMKTGGRPFVHDGSAYRELYRHNDVLNAAKIYNVWEVHGDALRQGIDNAVTIDNTTAMTANRTWFGGNNDLQVNITGANHAGFTSTAYAGVNRLYIGSGSISGFASTGYGALNQVFSGTTANSRHDALIGAYNHAWLSGASGSDAMYGSFNYARADVAETVDLAYGSLHRVIVSNGAVVTDAHLVSGSYSVTGGGVVTNKWGLNLVGQDKNHLDGWLEVDGIKFAPTQVNSSDANTLDDYEEGTFTPIVRGTTTAGTGTYTSQGGRYTKIGNRVYGQIVITWTAHTGSGNLEVAGLPFVHAAGNSTPVVIHPNNVALTAVGSTLLALVNASNSDISITQYGSAATGAAVAVPMDAAGTIRIGFQYETA